MNHYMDFGVVFKTCVNHVLLAFPPYFLIYLNSNLIIISYVSCIKVVNCCKMFSKIVELVLPSNPIGWQINKLGWHCLNQYHQLSFKTPFQNGVGIASLIFATFHFCCMLIDRLSFCIAKIQVIIVTSSFIVNILTPTFIVCVLPFRWLDREFRGMFHNLFAFFNVVLPPSIASIASSSASSIHFLLPFTIGNL